MSTSDLRTWRQPLGCGGSTPLWLRRVALVFCLSFFISPSANAAESPAKTPDALAAKSLPLRTALFHDPTLAPPFDRLLQLYREAGRAKELTDLNVEWGLQKKQAPAQNGQTR